MKSQTFLLLFVAILSGRAQSSATSSADHPTPTVEAAKPAQNASAASAQTKAPDAAVLAVPAPEASKTPAPAPASQKPDPSPIMAAVVVSGSDSADLKPALDFKKDMADMRAEQQANMAQQLADEAKKQKAAFVGMLASEQPMLFTPKPSNAVAPAAASAPSTESKNLVADARSK